jgi:hypothetical protein
MDLYLTVYKLLLRLYPRSYRREYEGEMVRLFEEMLAETASQGERLSLLSSSALETLRWSAPETIAQTEASVLATPSFIKAATGLSVLCVLPFLFVVVYRLHMAYDHEARPALLSLLAHTALLYQIVLPTIALSVVVSTAVWSLVKSQRYWHVSWASRLRSAGHNSLLIFALIGLLAVGILS